MMFKQIQGLSFLKEQNFTQSFIFLKLTFLEVDYFNELSYTLQSPFYLLFLTYPSMASRPFTPQKQLLKSPVN